jgi:hypothetical protein
VQRRRVKAARNPGIHSLRLGGGISAHGKALRNRFGGRDYRIRKALLFERTMEEREDNRQWGGREGGPCFKATGGRRVIKPSSQRFIPPSLADLKSRPLTVSSR